MTSTTVQTCARQLRDRCDGTGRTVLIGHPQIGPRPTGNRLAGLGSGPFRLFCPDLGAAMAATPAEVLADEVRAEVRSSGVDPQRDPAAVHRLAREVTRRHEQRSLTGAVAPLADEQAAVGEIVARVAGLGVLQPLLDDPEIEEIWVNEPSRVFVARRGRHELTTLVLDAEEVARAGRADAARPAAAGWTCPSRSWTRCCPDGHRLHVVIPDGIRRDFVAVNIRKFVAPGAPAGGAGRPGHAHPRGGSLPRRLRPRRAERSLVSGGTQAGKTTLLNCLAAAIPAQRAGGLLRGGLRAAVRPARLGADADPAAEPGGDRRGPAPPPGQGEPADAAEPAGGRRGPRRGVPGPAAGAQRRAAGHGAACMPTPRARRWSRPARCRCWPGRTSVSRSSCPPSRRPSTSSCTCRWTPDGTRRVDEIVAVPGRVEGGRHRDRVVFTDGEGRARAVRRAPAAPGAVRPRAASTSTELLGGGE